MRKKKNIIFYRKPNLKPFRTSKNQNEIDVFANAENNLEEDE